MPPVGILNLMLQNAVTRSTTAIVIIVVLVIAAVAAAAIYQYGRPGPSMVQTSSVRIQPTGNVIKIGVTQAMTGQFAVPGSATLKGIRTGVEWVNSNGGVKVGGKSYTLQVISYDDQSLSSNMVPLYTKLVTEDHVDFLIAPYSSVLEIAAAPVSERYSKVMVASACGTTTLFNQGFKYFVCVLSTSDQYLKPPIDYLKANHPSDKLAFVYPNDPTLTPAVNAAINYSLAMGFTVTYVSAYAPTATDLSAMLVAARNSGADDVLGGGHTLDGELLVKQLQQIGWKPKLVSVLLAVEEHQFYDALGKSAEGVTGSLFWEPTMPYGPSFAAARNATWYGPTQPEFLRLFKQVTGEEKTPSANEAEGAADVLVLAKAIEQANSLDQGIVRATLGKMYLVTFFGEFRIDSTGHQNAKPTVLAQWQNGKLEVVYPPDVATAKPQYPYNPPT
jgi:branched-chain amino acid transport system substrate-binding protein